MVLQQETYMKDEYTVVIKITNPVQHNLLDRFRSDLTVHLKTKLNNGKINIDTEQVEENSQRKYYTNSDKFRYLAEKKPIINQLKDRLGLDPDF